MIRVGGAAAAGETLGEMAERIRQNLAAAIEEETKALQADAKRRCPVETGALRESIQMKIQERGDAWEAAVGSALPYAAAVELGTLQRAAQPYLAPALQQRKGALTQRVQEALQGALRRKRV